MRYRSVLRHLLEQSLLDHIKIFTRNVLRLAKFSFFMVQQAVFLFKDEFWGFHFRFNVLVEG